MRAQVHPLGGWYCSSNDILNEYWNRTYFSFAALNLDWVPAVYLYSEAAGRPLKSVEALSSINSPSSWPME